MVTGYQIGKWSRGVLLIISGIFMISVLNEFQINIRMAPSYVRDTATIEFITMLIYYSIVSSFVYAAVSITAGFIGKKKGMNLSELDKRINALDKSIQTVNWPTSSAGIMSTTPAMKSAEPIEKAAKKGKAVAIAVVAILIIAAVAIGLVMLAFNGSPEPGAASPEQAFNTFLDRMNAGDAEGAIGKTAFSLASNSSDYVNMLDQMLSSGSVHISLVSGPTVFTEQMLSEDEKSNISARVAEIESSYGVDVTKYSVVSFKISVSTPGGSQTISERMPCVFINDKWYLDVRELFSNRGPNGGDGKKQNDVKVILRNDGTNNGNWTLTVIGIDNATGPVADSQVLLKVTKADSTSITFQLSNMASGATYNGIVFNDIPPMGELSSGDEFLLDETTYAVGSELKLTDSSGSTVYADIMI